VSRLDLLVIGDAMVDVTVKPPRNRPGGAYPSTILVSPGGLGNVAVAAALSGTRVGFVGKVGNDVVGDLYQSDLRSYGILSFVQRCDVPTGICINFVRPGGERTMYTSRGANELLASEDVPDRLLRQARMIFVSGFSMETANSATQIEGICSRAKDLGRQVAVGGGAYNLITRRRERFRRLAHDDAAILILNEQEALALTDRNAIAPALEALGDLVKFFVVTMGERGSALYQDGSLAQIPLPFPLRKAVDTTGAGDVFAGTLLAGILGGKAPIESIRLAHLRAGESVAHLGPRLPRPAKP